mgnify:FL=1
MFKKGSKLFSVFFLKCPRCHGSDLFIQKNPYRLKNYFEMNNSCHKCKQSFNMEPGFYFGSMYVSYGTSIAWLTINYFTLLIIYPNFSIELFLSLGLTSLIIISPYLFRLSRAIWINLFVKYENIIRISESDTTNQKNYHEKQN